MKGGRENPNGRKGGPPQGLRQEATKGLKNKATGAAAGKGKKQKMNPSDAAPAVAPLPAVATQHLNSAPATQMEDGSPSTADLTPPPLTTIER